MSKVSLGYAAYLVDAYFKPMAQQVYGDAVLPQAKHHAAMIARLIRKEQPRIINASQLCQRRLAKELQKVENVRLGLDVL